MKLADVPFVPNVPPPVYEMAKKWLVDSKEEHRQNGNFAIFDMKGKSEKLIGMACHNAISLSSLADRCCVATEIGLKRAGRLKDPEVLRFLSWFLQDSPYSRFILNRNDFDFCRDYGIIVSADVTTQIMQNIMIMSRHFHEIELRSFKMFCKLVDSGIPATIAYPVCFNTYYSVEFTRENQAVQSCSGHRAHPLFNLDAWKNWHAGEIGSMFKFDPTDTKLHYRNSNNFMGGVFLWHNKGLPDSYAYDQGRYHFVYDLMKGNEKFRADLSEYRRDKTENKVYHPPNPFKRDPNGAAPLPADQVTYPEFFDFVVPWSYKNGVLFNVQLPAIVPEEEVRIVVNG